MKRKRRRLSKKKLEQLEREEAEKESKARSESEKRQEGIKLLWDLKEQDLKAKTYEQRKLKEQKLKEQKLKTLQSCIKLLAPEEELEEIVRELIERAELKDHGLLPWLDICKLVGEVADLAHLQDREIDYLTQFRRDWERIHAHYPQKLEQLEGAILMAELRALIATLPKRKPQAVFEDKRRIRKQPGDVGLIEWEFGGGAEEQRQKVPMALPYEPTCLDEIFAGGAVRMRSEDVALNAQSSSPLAWWLPKAQHRVGLEELFGIERHRFGKGLPPIENGRERRYNYRAVVKIMHRLLSEKKREDKRPRRGKTPRLWPSNPALRMRVLIGIHERMESVSVSEDIWGAFTAVICFHLTKGIEGRLSEDVKNALAALVRRYLA